LGLIYYYEVYIVIDLGLYLVMASLLSSIPVWIVAMALASIAESAKRK
jgi:hypothetical protein